MNFKACCGLLASNKDDEDHDYEDVGQAPLPKPRPAADLRLNVSVHWERGPQQQIQQQQVFTERANARVHSSGVLCLSMTPKCFCRA